VRKLRPELLEVLDEELELPQDPVRSLSDVLDGLFPNGDGIPHENKLPYMGTESKGILVYDFGGVSSEASFFDKRINMLIDFLPICFR
jgi:hypothetical protein